MSSCCWKPLNDPALQDFHRLLFMRSSSHFGIPDTVKNKDVVCKQDSETCRTLQKDNLLLL